MSDQDGRERGVLGRRHFLKVVALSGSALAAASLIKLIDPESLDSALATLGTGPYYYGTDTSWDVDYRFDPLHPDHYNPSHFPQNFYIGRTGSGLNILDDASFYPVAADKAGVNYTHTYWDLKGPYYKWIGTRTPYQYGYDQGRMAASARLNHRWATKIGGKTIFADIERGQSSNPDSDLFDGWRYFIDGVEYVDISKNRALFEGFLDGVYGYSPDLNPGIYTRLDLWQSWFSGTNYDPNRAYVVWLAGHPCMNCPPCDVSCETAKSEADNNFNMKKETAFGKYKTVIWQFYIKSAVACNDVCIDYDIAQQKGDTRFTPIKATYLPLTKSGNRLLRSSDPTESSKTYPPP